MTQPSKATATSLEDAVPIPPRFWWLKRLTVVGGLLLLTLLVVRLWWGWHAERKLQAVIDEIVARGEPIYPADFNPKEEIRDDENAAKFLIDAGAALNIQRGDRDILDKVYGNPLRAQRHLKEMKRIIEANVKALDLVRQARTRSGVDWGVRVSSPAINTMLPSVPGQRSLVKLLAAITIHEHMTGNDANAIERCEDILSQADTIDSHAIQVTHLAALAGSALGVNVLEAIMHDLQISAEAQGTGAASPEQIRRLIIHLLSDDLSTGFVRAMQSERMIMLDFVNLLNQGKTGVRSFISFNTIFPVSWAERVLTWAIKPFYSMDGVRALEYGTGFVTAASASTFPEAKRWYDHPGEAPSPFGKITAPISTTFLPSLQRSVITHFQAIAQRRMAAIALAIRLYEVEHGHRPILLDELLPSYLKDIPADPFADDVHPINYKPDADPPILYTFGVNGIDDDASLELFRTEEGNWCKLDLVFFLNGDRPVP